MNVQFFIEEINNYENIDLKRRVRAFEKKLLKCFRLYDDGVGFEDYRMNDLDYLILYSIWKATKLDNCIDDYLIIMYSYYKLEEFYFPLDKFPNYLSTIDLIMDTEIINIINSFIEKCV